MTAFKALPVGLLLLCSLAGQAVAHECGPGELTIEAGQSASYTIAHAPGETTVADYTVQNGGNTAIATVSPPSIDAKLDGDFQITGVAPGVTTMTLHWQRTAVNPPPQPFGTCIVAVTVAAPAAPGQTTANQPSAPQTPGDPVNIGNGEYFFAEAPDLYVAGPAPLFFSRYYGSFIARDGSIGSALGPNWLHSFDFRLAVAAGGNSVRVTDNRGRVIRFDRAGATWALSHPRFLPYQLIQAGGGYAMADPQAERVYSFDGTGRLTKIQDRRGNGLTLQYQAGRLVQVGDGHGRTLNFAYDGGGRLESVTDGTAAVHFEYSGNLLTSATDARGNVTTYVYDDQHAVVGLMRRKVWPEGNSPLTQFYDAAGRVAMQDDPQGNRTSFDYQADRTTVTDPAGAVRVYVKNADGTLASFVDPEGRTIAFAYDPSGRRTGFTDRLGHALALTFHPGSGRAATITDPLGSQTSYAYTARAFAGFTFYDLTEVAQPDGGVLLMSYDPSGNPIAIDDKAGQAWHYAYNANGQVTRATNPAGGVTSFVYGADLSLASITNASGNTTQFVRDARKRLRRIVHPDQTFVEYAYDGNDNAVSISDEAGNVIGYTYDRNDRLVTLTDRNGALYSFAYDQSNRRTALTDPLGATTTLAYDSRGLRTQITNALGESVSIAYDSRGLAVSLSDPDGFTRTFSRDAEGSLVGITDPAGQAWHYTRDKLGRMAVARSPLDALRSFFLDPMGRLAGYTNPIGRSSTYAYDERGLTASMAVPGGITVAYARNAIGQVVGITGPLGETWSRTYDPAGRITSETDPMSRVTSYAYDARSRLADVTLPEGSLAISYDARGNIVRKTYSDGLDLEFAYDNNGRLREGTGFKLAYDARGAMIESNGLAITRDDAGRILTIAYAPGKNVGYAYNRRGLVTRVTDWVGGSTDLTYDAEGRPVSLSRPNGVITNYAYDNDGRLTGVSHSKGAAVLASLQLLRNAEGEIVEADRTYPTSANPTTPRSFAYNNAHEIVGYSYDRMGRLVSDGGRTYGWDLASRLKSVGDASGTTTFDYDGIGMRIARTSAGVVDTYAIDYASGQPQLAVVRRAGVDRQYYVYLPDGTLLHGIAADDRRSFYGFDEVGSTIFLADEAGAVTDSYGVGPFGEVTAGPGATDNPFVFLGALGVMREGQAGLHYMRARYYDSASQRFVSRDPLPGISPSSLNPYQYALANPLRYVDPLGLVATERDPTLKAPNNVITHFIQATDYPDTSDTILVPPPQPPPKSVIRGSVLILTDYTSGDSALFRGQEAYFADLLRSSGVTVHTVNSANIAALQAGQSGDIGLSQQQLRTVTGIITIGHGDGGRVAEYINGNLMQSLLQQTGSLQFVALWGCNSYSFYENNQAAFLQHMAPGGAIFGYSSFLNPGAVQSGFSKGIFQSDPFAQYVSGKLPGGEYPIFDYSGAFWGWVLK